MDVHEPAVRSYNMSRIRSRDTKPEMIVRKFLHGQGYRYGLHNKSLPGTPDLVLRKLRIVIFVHGCFWHGHEGCRYFVLPKTRAVWWKEKIERNKSNDNRSAAQLKKAGWRVLNIFECDLKPVRREKTLARLLAKLEKS